MSAKVEIFTKFACPFCMRAKMLLDSKGVDYIEFDAAGDAIRQEMLARANGRTSVPQIFIDGVHIGGCDDLFALNDGNKLDALLNRTGNQ
jgi:glutaredoxin 3